ncbi:hypothetical protein B0T26DRAFT_722787 [Lasiosphaeria miniovina]|uniref:Secreted protein n=1 Tax=Lasiosphaeria miniovina TaxID=1954250 RepID=A0AA40A5T3_9PEZI|nr:uncharacterized protein B0T26DRAFT_722787 [Lasiosphaeria miniovina]KAK0709735.1 hypothetical protein B0T26DRAFT_722787 [Lasiosphaeria miniovina]
MFSIAVAVAVAVAIASNMAARENISSEIRLAINRKVGVSRHHQCRSTIACLASPHPTSHPKTQLVRRQNAQDRPDMFTFAEQHAARRCKYCR